MKSTMILRLSYVVVVRDTRKEIIFNVVDIFITTRRSRNAAISILWSLQMLPAPNIVYDYTSHHAFISGECAIELYKKSALRSLRTKNAWQANDILCNAWWNQGRQEANMCRGGTSFQGHFFEKKGILCWINFCYLNWARFEVALVGLCFHVVIFSKLSSR